MGYYSVCPTNTVRKLDKAQENAPLWRITGTWKNAGVNFYFSFEHSN